MILLLSIISIFNKCASIQTSNYKTQWYGYEVDSLCSPLNDIFSVYKLENYCKTQSGIINHIKRKISKRGDFIQTENSRFIKYILEEDIIKACYYFKDGTLFFCVEYLYQNNYLKNIEISLGNIYIVRAFLWKEKYNELLQVENTVSLNTKTILKSIHHIENYRLKKYDIEYKNNNYIDLISNELSKFTNKYDTESKYIDGYKEMLDNSRILETILDK